MQPIKSIGVVGQGFVGTAVREGMKHAVNVETFDKYLADRSTCKDLDELCTKATVIFVCVPTPMKATGQCDISIVDEVISQLRDASYRTYSRNVFVIKSTIPPGTTELLHKKYASTDVTGPIAVLHNAEFLTEANAINDFKNQDRILVGVPEGPGGKSGLIHVREVYEQAYPHVKFVALPSKEEEMVKYVGNCFLASKVSFANEIYQICQKSGMDYDRVINAARLDKRLGDSHWTVPGPMLADDGSGRRLYGFSGSCFPKDINALRYYAESLDIDPKMLSAAWEKNLEVRPERDWEKLTGRAVSKEKSNE